MALDVCAATANLARDSIDDLEFGEGLAAKDYKKTTPGVFGRIAASVGYVTDDARSHDLARRAIIEIDLELGEQRRILGREIMNAGSCAARAAIAPRNSALSRRR